MTDDTDRDDREPTDFGGAASTSDGRTASGADHGREAPLDPTDLDRLFDVLDAGVGEDAALVESEQDQLLSVLEAVLSSPAQVEGDELEQLFSVLESTIAEPAAPETAEEVLSVLEATLGNPARLDPTETEGLLSVLESAVVDPSDPGATAREAFSLADALGLDTPATGAEPESEPEAETGAVDPADPVGSAESVLDSLGLAPGGARREDPDDADTGSRPTVGSTADDSAAMGAADAVADDGDLDRPFRVARIVAAATQRSTDYSLRSGVRTGTRLVRAVRESESLDELLDETRGVAFAELDRLGIDVGDANDPDDAGERPPDDCLLSEATLRARGARLLERSADVDHDESIHPAFPRILDELAADEARILRLLATEGPQPSVDVRDVGWLPITSELVAAGLSMIGAEAGCRHEDRTPASLNNLQRLGLLWFSDESVRNVRRYQVLEAQPHVAEAVDSCRRAKVIRRSIHLTPFGVDFCRVCLPVDVAAEDAAGAYEAPADLTE